MNVNVTYPAGTLYLPFEDNTSRQESSRVTQRRISPSVVKLSETQSVPCPWSQSSSVLAGSIRALLQEPLVKGVESSRKHTGQRRP